MNMHAKRLFSGLFLVPLLFMLLFAARPSVAQQDTEAVTLESMFLDGYKWRNLGPDRGGRSIAVSGVVGQPMVAYFGATGGGLWKTDDGGENWQPVTDFQIEAASVGAVAVSETDPDLVFIGMGESCIRGNIIPGDGVYRSRDAGETWEHVGFSESDAISKIRIHPTNPDIIYVASFGRYSAPSEERGIFRSMDGGDTWERILFRNDETGGIDIAIDRNDPDVMYAALWEAFRKEYTASSGGPGSGMFKSTDGGDTWAEMTRNPGMPQEGVVGKIGIAVSSADSDRVYALFEHADGGLFRSDDAGATWELVNDERRIRQRAFYYTHVFADHQDPDVVYVQNTSFFRSEDGGETYEVIDNGTHGDFHDLWIDPADPSHLVVANDGGGAVSYETGAQWTDQEFPTAQFYRVNASAHLPFHVCGSQQDNSTLCMPSDWNADREPFGFGTPGRRRSEPATLTEGSMDVAYVVGGGEPGYVEPDPKDLSLYYAGVNNGRYIDKYDRILDLSREVVPYPWFYSGEPAIDMVERWQWTFPIIFSPVNPNVLYTSSNHVWRTTDGGDSWDRISPDLTRADPSTLGPTGGPITHDMNGPEVYATIFALGPSKIDERILWAGSDDGLVHVTRDGGASWTDVTPPDMPEFGRVSQIDASAFEPGRAYVSVRRPLLNDKAPYIWKTDDYGESWTKIVDGIRHGAFVHSVREDPTRQGLLYAGTNHGVYISFDDGAHWQELNPGFPDLPVAGLVVHDNALAIASHGRGYWILDNIAPLRQLTATTTDRDAVLFDPPTAHRSANGVILSWWLKDEPGNATLEILDSSGAVLHTWEKGEDTDEDAEEDEDGEADEIPWRLWERWEDPAIPAEAGLNHFHWDLKTEPATIFPGMILWGIRTMAPHVPPGTYTVRLTADGHTETTEIEVERNPWLTDITDADLHAQYEFSRRIWAKVNEANNAVIAIRRVKAQLADRLARADDDALERAADRLVENATAVEGDIYQIRNRSNQDPLNFPIKVNNRLANLLSMVERGDGRPNQGMRDVFQIMVDRLAGYTDRLDEVWRTDLAAVNRELQRLGLEPLDPSEPTELRPFDQMATGP